MNKKTRKICIPGPTRLRHAEKSLRKAGREVILGKSVDDFPEYRYQRKELIDLIGGSDALMVTTREVIGGDVLDSCH